MGVEFYLACSDCKEFIELHKWPVVEEAGNYLVHAHYERGEFDTQLYPEDSPFPLCDLDTHCKKIELTSDQILEALTASPPDHEYIHELKPVVQKFASDHEGHSIFLSCDLGDPDEDPWSTTQLGFDDWLEVPGVFHYYAALPRNLMEVSKLSTWDDVLEKMQDEWPFCYHVEEEIESIHSAFERRIALKNIEQR